MAKRLQRLPKNKAQPAAGYFACRAHASRMTPNHWALEEPHASTNPKRGFQPSPCPSSRPSGDGLAPLQP